MKFKARTYSRLAVAYVGDHQECRMGFAPSGYIEEHTGNSVGMAGFPLHDFDGNWCSKLHLDGFAVLRFW